MSDDHILDDLMQLVSDHLEAERSDISRRAAEFAKRLAPKIRARNVGRKFPRRSLLFRSAPVIARISVAQSLSRESHCAPLLELPVAAGEGRELWDELCDTWIELPGEIPDARYLALRVAGDSMVPFIESRDVILVQLDCPPAVDDVIVARRPDEGYVVKRVARIGLREMELDSFNPSYDPIRIPLGEMSVLGTVVARFRQL
jgi:SOS-response transcriptional repressor LexA